jgi:DNA repair protein RecO (recombination protein O)
MATVHDEGVVVHCLPYSETSLIAVWLTRDHGILRTLAKGARRPRQAFHGRIDLLRAGTLSFSLSQSSQLHTLREFTPEVPGPSLGGDYAKLLAASYFYEVIARLSEPQAPVPELYHLYRKALAWLENHPPDRRVVEHFEKRVFEAAGLHDASAAPARLRHRLLQPPPKSWPALAATWGE